jgi:23S rRNA pseudouridine1911/1915/1917 synthase
MAEAADGRSRQLALAEIHLQTGRHHQIRVQMSQEGMSLLGDYKYADESTIAISEQMKIKEIALCACRLAFNHPVSGERMQFEITPEGRSFQIFAV